MKKIRNRKKREGAALLIVILFMPGGLLPFIVERVRLRGGQSAAVKEVRP